MSQADSVVQLSMSPTQAQIATIMKFVRKGKNKVEFVQDNERVASALYLWDQDEKIVISDVDGTVTKSDGLGHFLPRIGIDWAHDGIAKLYTDIFNNGYKILYLSSRPIGYSGSTKKYLEGIKQDKKHVMPDGPLLLSPDRMAKSFYREVIIKQPHVFKIQCLSTIKNLFPPPVKPFYAGFGNRDTDYISYSKLGIGEGKIFIINPKGEIKQNQNSRYKKSYPSINLLVDMMFPSVKVPNPGNSSQKSPPKTELRA